MVSNQLKQYCATDVPPIQWKLLSTEQIRMTLLGAVINRDRVVINRARRALKRRGAK